MNEHEPVPRLAPETGEIDWRRLYVAVGRFANRIGEGIARARTEHHEIDDDTARMIAHVLGRGYGRDSALAGFGRTGEGGYLALRDEYLPLYNSPEIQPVTKELIDWFGTYLVERENTGSGRQYMNEYQPPKLDRLLVATGVFVHGEPFTVHLPASLDASGIDALTEELTTLRLDEDEALQAYLSLPDVDANTEMLMESFHDNFVATFTSLEDAVRGLCEIDAWEREVNDFAADRGLFIDQYTIDYEMLRDRLRDGYDLVEWKDAVHAFYK